MPLDTSIYQQPAPQGFNTPFQTLAQIGALQQQRQQIASNKALEDERQQRLKDEHKKQADAEKWTQVLSHVDLFNRDEMVKQVQANAPDRLPELMKYYNDFDAKKQDYEKSKQETAAAAALTKERMYGVVGHVANVIAGHNYSPEAIAAGLNELNQQFPESKQTWDNYQQLFLQNGPQFAKEHIDGLRSMADKETAAKIPGTIAESASKVKTEAGMSPTGITAEQQAQNKNAAGQLAVAQGRLSLEQQKAKDEAAAKVTKAAQGRPLLSSDVNKISDLDKSISELKDLGERLKTGAGMGAMARAEAAIVPGGLAPYVPGAEAAKATAADIKLAQQVAGRAVHGGVMRKNDQEQAEQYLPKQDDPPQVVQAKLANILKLANDSKIGHIENLKRGGFDVSGFQSALGSASIRKEIPGHPGNFAVSKDGGQTWQAE